jgi:hypothetical protein
VIILPQKPRLRTRSLKPFLAGKNRLAGIFSLGKIGCSGSCACGTPTPTPTPVPCSCCGGKNLISGTLTDDNGTNTLVWDDPTSMWYVENAGSFTAAPGCVCATDEPNPCIDATDFTLYYGYIVHCIGTDIDVQLMSFVTFCDNPGGCAVGGFVYCPIVSGSLCSQIGPGLLPPGGVAENNATPTCVGSPHGTMTVTMSLTGTPVLPAPATFATVVFNY